MRHTAKQNALDDRFAIDSAGTGDWHIGEPPDHRAIAVAARHGVDISDQRARQLERDDFHRFDLILGMDHSNVQNITRMAAFDSTATIDLFHSQATGALRDVADPYFGAEADFEMAYRDIQAGTEALAALLTGKMPRTSG